MKVLITSIFSILLSGFVLGQLTTSNGSASSLVQNILLGPGVTVSNIQYNGSNVAIGSFNGMNTNLGLSSGIIMTTGTIQNTGDGPHGPNNRKNAGINNNTPGITLLSNLIGGQQTYNASVLQFDFVPYSDSVSFRYIFGSEEYPEFVGSEFNDVFGFFISGPGISGQQNIAKLPNGTPVTINNINSGSNSNFFVNNGDGTNGPYNSSATYIQYDGYTNVLTASSKVQCGETYHLVIAIADVMDGIYDSGIFLEANSLKSKMPVDVSYTLSYQAFTDPSKMIEGCTNANFKLQRGGNISSALTVPIEITGSATNSVDYTNIPASITFPPNQSVYNFNFDAINDGIVEPEENVHLKFILLNPCNDTVPIEFDLKIVDILPITIQVNDTNMLCPGDPGILIASVTGGGGPFSYVWSTGETTSTIAVSPSTTTTYTCSVTDNCLNQTVSDNGTVSIPVYPPITLTTTPNITEICPYLRDTLQVSAQGGAGSYSYQWSSSKPELLGKDIYQPIYPSQTTVYTVIVEDQCGVSEVASTLYYITSPPLLTEASDTTICPADSAKIYVNASGGYGMYYYDWIFNHNNTSSQKVNPSITTEYIVRVSDECQTFYIEDTAIVRVIKPTADFDMISTLVFDHVPISFQNMSLNANSYFWTFGDGQSSTINSPNNTYLESGTYPVTLYVTDYLGCKDSITKLIFIEEEHYIYVPNTFTPDGNRYNTYFYASTIGITDLSINIFNKWGELVYNSDDVNFRWDGTYENTVVQDGTYIYKIQYTAKSGYNDLIIGHVNVIQ